MSYKIIQRLQNSWITGWLWAYDTNTITGQITINFRFSRKR